MDNFSYAEELLSLFELNPNTGMKRMSKGMKQKIGIVAAYEGVSLLNSHFPNVILREKQNQAIVTIQDEQINELIALLGQSKLHFLKEEKHTLEEYFMQFYGGETK